MEKDAIRVWKDSGDYYFEINDKHLLKKVEAMLENYFPIMYGLDIAPRISHVECVMNSDSKELVCLAHAKNMGVDIILNRVNICSYKQDSSIWDTHKYRKCVSLSDMVLPPSMAKQKIMKYELSSLGGE